MKEFLSIVMKDFIGLAISLKVTFECFSCLSCGLFTFDVNESNVGVVEDTENIVFILEIFFVNNSPVECD